MKSNQFPLIFSAIVAAPLISGIDARGSSSRSVYTPHRRSYDYHRRNRPYAFDLVTDMFSLPLYSTNSLFRQQHDQLARMEQNSAPRYSISHSEDGALVELAMEVPGVPAKDLSVEVENGNILRIKGSRTIREYGSLTKTEFDQSFQLDQDIDVENIAVSLSSGILTVAAPKKEAAMKRIQFKIMESEDPVQETSNNELEISKEGRDDPIAVHESNVDDDRETNDFVITVDEDSL